MTVSGIRRIGILGPLHTYTHQAALEYYGDGKVEVVPYATIDDVFDKVEAGEVEEGVVPEENVIEGTVRATMDGYYNRQVHLKGKVVIPIHHCLGALEGATLGKITHITTKPEAYSQTSIWRLKNIHNAQFVAANSTADAAREISERQLKGYAAIAPEIAIEAAGLSVVASGIGNTPNNKTRFGVIGTGILKPDLIGEPTGHDETTIVIHPTHDYAGQLESWLHQFSSNDISLTRIESRPGIVSRTPSDRRGERMTYLFPLSFKGHYRDANVQKALADLMLGICVFDGTAVKLVGSHRRADLYNNGR